MPKYAAILAAAGRSRRFNVNASSLGTSATKKPFVLLKGRAVWLYSVERLARRSDVVQIILVVSSEDKEEVERKFAAEISMYGIDVVEGGAERYLSVENALKALKSSVEYVAVHDAARPCVGDAEIDAVFAEAARSGAAILATPVVGSLKRSRGDVTRAKSETELLRERLGFGASEPKKKSSDPFSGMFDDEVEQTVVDCSVSRVDLWEAQTPQVFERKTLERAYRERPADLAPTDDSGLVEALGKDVSIVEGSRVNIKITTAEDLVVAEKFMEIVAKRDVKPRKFF